MSEKRIPVTIITGFLGSGKTTLLRHLLTHTNHKLAVIVNEFGTVGLDGDLIKGCNFCSEEHLEERIVELKNGCLCCTVQEDFLPTMQALIGRSHELDGIVVETSGLALPRPLVQAIEWPEIRSHVFVNGLVSLVDGEALSQGSPVGDIDSFNEQINNDENLDHMISINELFKDQLLESDLVLISRSDLLNSHLINDLKNYLSKMVRDSTNILPLSFGNIDPSIILGLDRKISNKDNSQNLLNDEHEHEHEHEHIDVLSENIRLECEIDKKKLQDILLKVIPEFKILRVKGRCWLKDKLIPLQVQMVGPRFSCWFESAPKGVWKPKSTGIELVILSLKHGAGSEISSSLGSSLN